MTIREALLKAHTSFLFAELNIERKRYEVAIKSCMVCLNQCVAVLNCIHSVILPDDDDIISAITDISKVTKIYNLPFEPKPSYWENSDTLSLVKAIDIFKLNRKTAVEFYEYTKRVLQWCDPSETDTEDRESVLQMII